jgi:substrate-binding family protein
MTAWPRISREWQSPISPVRRFVAAAAVASLALQPALAAAADVVIGALLPMTGGNAPNGAQKKTGYELAVEEINAQGGIKALGGAKLKLVVRDHEWRSILRPMASASTRLSRAPRSRG